MRISKNLPSFLAMLAIIAIASPQAQADEIITCKSNNYNYKHCQVKSKVSHASVYKQRSNTECRKGRNWDYDRGGIWVDEGCSADFLVETDGNGSNNNNNNQSNSNNNSGGETMYGMKITRDIKRNSNDYKSYISGSLQLCARQCANDNRCQSFNYGKAKKDCHLKDNVVSGVHNNTVVSGVK